MIDSHAHLHHRDFEGDRDAVVERLREAGVTRVLEVGIDRPGAETVLALAERYPELRVAVGCHPHESATWNDEFAAAMRGWAKHPKVLAFGELGLDFFRNYAPRDVQDRAFREQLRLAAELDMPVIFHVRAAEQEFLRVLDEEGDPRRAVLHAFSHDMAFAAACIARGFWLGIGGILTFPTSTLPGILKEISIERILLETDCPWLSPVPKRGKRNEPAHLRHVLDRLAEIHGRSPEELDAQLDANFAAFCGDREVT